MLTTEIERLRSENLQLIKEVVDLQAEIITFRKSMCRSDPRMWVSEHSLNNEFFPGENTFLLKVE